MLCLPTTIRLAVAALFLLLLPAGALSGPECLQVARAGTVTQLRDMLAQHSPEELFRVRDKAGHGLVHHCLRRGAQYWRPLLEAGWPVDREKGWTPQHEAALLGDSEAVEELLRRGANPAAREPLNGGTPLHVAAFNGHLEVVKRLVGAGVEVNARDQEGWTALSQARDQGFPNIVDWLKRHGATR